MPTKRTILSKLFAEELGASAGLFDLGGFDGRDKDALVDALARFRKARIDEILVNLPRKRLKELCREFGLSDSGKMKADIAARLSGRAERGNNRASKVGGARGRASKVRGSKADGSKIHACLWFLSRNKNPGRGWRDRRGEVLFIDARKFGRMVDRTRRELADEEIGKIARTYHAWRGEKSHWRV